MMPKTCMTCRYALRQDDEYPCNECQDIPPAGMSRYVNEDDDEEENSNE